MEINLHYYTLYVLPKGSVESVANALFPRFGLAPKKVSSSTWGDYYISAEIEEEEIISVYSNEDNDDGVPIGRVRAYPNHPVLISVYNTERYEELRDYILGEFNAAIVEDDIDPPPPPEPFY